MLATAAVVIRTMRAWIFVPEDDGPRPEDNVPRPLTDG